MDYKSNLLKTVGFVSFFVLFSAVSMAEEALFWRIVSENEEKEVVPAYENGATPFPIKIAPKVEVNETVFVETEEDARLKRERERRSLLASEVLAEIRNLLENDSAFNPDISTSRVEGVIFGENGKMALIDNNWLKEGDALKVPTRTKERLADMISTLKSLEPDLAAMIEDEVAQKTADAKELQLNIKEIGEGYINLIDDRQKLHIMSFQVSKNK